ncbi:MAG TPA: hypothetical protein H9805_04645 [Candidatus Janibacter merdipullorum]|nr:hypothetical protein [Candidatus Janibacter merdipullorum]
MKNWMTCLNALRPSARRHGGADARLRSAKSAPEFHEPYDRRMADRFRPQLSTR